nr:hypothetical protein [Pseudomonadota bacterium]
MTMTLNHGRAALLLAAVLTGGAAAQAESAQTPPWALDEVAVQEVTFEPPVQGATPLPGRRYLAVELVYRNLRPQHRYRLNLSEAVAVVEDGQYVYPPDPATSGVTPAFAEDHVFAPGEAMAGTLLFQVPQTTGHLALVHYTAQGPMVIGLTPGTAAAPPPPPLAGPVQSG